MSTTTVLGEDFIRSDESLCLAARRGPDGRVENATDEDHQADN